MSLHPAATLLGCFFSLDRCCSVFRIRVALIGLGCFFGLRLFWWHSPLSSVLDVFLVALGLDVSFLSTGAALSLFLCPTQLTHSHIIISLSCGCRVLSCGCLQASPHTGHLCRNPPIFLYHEILCVVSVHPETCFGRFVLKHPITVFVLKPLFLT